MTEPSQDEDVIPTTGETAEEQETPAPQPDEQLTPAEEIEDDLTVAQRAVGELTDDLQRLQAEFVNYKRRVERDRELIRENATYAALAPITEVLDTIDRAREHEELTGGF